jgi:hypothetical protein
MNSGASRNTVDTLLRLSFPVAAPCPQFIQVAVMVRLDHPMDHPQGTTQSPAVAHPRRPGGNNNHDGAGLPSLALQALYANNAVKHAFADFGQPSMTLDLGSDDDDDNWEENMDPITFARYYAAGNPLLAKIVQEHDQKMRERLDQGIANWVEGVQSETS